MSATLGINKNSVPKFYEIFTLPSDECLSLGAFSTRKVKLN